jgi:hypothetical protein
MDNEEMFEIVIKKDYNEGDDIGIIDAPVVKTIRLRTPAQIPASKFGNTCEFCEHPMCVHDNKLTPDGRIEVHGCYVCAEKHRAVRDYKRKMLALIET